MLIVLHSNNIFFDHNRVVFQLSKSIMYSYEIRLFRECFSSYRLPYQYFGKIFGV